MEEIEFYPLFFRNHCTRHLFRGTFARDEIRKQTPEPGLYIVNTAPRRSAGEHWVLFFISPKNKQISFFDSFGMIPLYKEFYDFIGSASKFYYSKKTIQGSTSATCGFFCLYVGALLCCGMTLQECTRKFSATNQGVNDRLIPILVWKEFESPEQDLTCSSVL